MEIVSGTSGQKLQELMGAHGNQQRMLSESGSSTVPTVPKPGYRILEPNTEMIFSLCSVSLEFIDPPKVHSLRGADASHLREKSCHKMEDMVPACFGGTDLGPTV